MEAVVTDHSLLVGCTPSQVRLDERYGVHLLAVSRSGKRITQRMRAVSLQAGDVVVLRGNLMTMPESLGELRCLPLAGRDLRLGRRGRSLLPLSILAIAMGLAAAHVVPVAIGFFGAAVVLLLLKSLTLREAYEALDWPILIMLGALIPVSDALRTTGGTELIASLLSATADRLPALGALALIMVTAMAVTPFLNNAATVLVMAPIAASFAYSLGYSPDPSDGGGDRGGVRLPDPDRPSVQPASDGPRRLQFRGLLEARPSALDHGRCRRRAADRVVLAVQAGLSPCRGPDPHAFFELLGSFGSVLSPCP
jgi:di/tricarboxylate transporter